jgi:sugar phosphate isomerase/epimerase
LPYHSTVPQPIAVQLYSLREEAERDLDATVARLAGIGFLGLETAELHGRTAAEFRALVGAHGMEICSSHGLAVGEAAASVFDQAAALGSPLVVVPFAAPDRFATEEGVAGVAAELNAALPLARERGLGLGYHNHFWEWTELPGGRVAFDLLLEQLDPEVVLELDIYWAQTAGQAPASLLSRLGNRVARLHMKDGPADSGASAMTAAGEGKVDLAGAAAASPAPWHIVELDRCDTDMFDAIERSYVYLIEHGISAGRTG